MVVTKTYLFTYILILITKQNDHFIMSKCFLEDSDILNMQIYVNKVLSTVQMNIFAKSSGSNHNRYNEHLFFDYLISIVWNDYDIRGSSERVNESEYYLSILQLMILE